jgi:hypothetical protein
VKKFTLFAIILCFLWLGGSLWYWLSQPNNFLYTVETTGRWNFEKVADYKARGFHLKINPACAGGIYSEIEKTNSKNSSHDYRRFLGNRAQAVEFSTAEISSPSRFKWLSEDYTTYDDPGLASGIRYSFRNRCLFDRECTLRDSTDYLFIKIGVKYFLQETQRKQLESCVAAKEIFYQVTSSYNFGRSDRHYRNGILLWLGDRTTTLPLAVLFFLAIV